MKAADLTIGQQVLVHGDNRTFPARVKGFGPKPYEVIVIASNRHGSVTLTVHEYNVELDKEATASGA